MAISFNLLKKQVETSNQRSNKRARQKIEDTKPTAVISQATTGTINNETGN